MAVVKTVLGALVIPLAVASGCAMTPVPNEKDLVDALTDDLSFAQKQIIETKISDWFGGIKITLADDVFSESSQVSIERKAHLDERRLPIEGRHNNPAFTFTLLTEGEHCVLRNDLTGDIEKLSDISCLAQ